MRAMVVLVGWVVVLVRAEGMVWWVWGGSCREGAVGKEAVEEEVIENQVCWWAG